MQVKKGQTVEGKVTGITKYGAFVNIDGETSGMIHISEISDGFINDISEILQINQTVKAVVIGINDNGKLALSIKQAEQRAARRESPNFKKFEKPAKNATGSNPNSLNSLNSFEDMMSKFKRDSDEKMSNLKSLEQKRVGPPRRRKD